MWIYKAGVSSLSIVGFDDEIIKNWKLPVASLHTFWSTQESMSLVAAVAACEILWIVIQCLFVWYNDNVKLLNFREDACEY